MRLVAIAIVVLVLPSAVMAATPPKVTVSGKISGLTLRSITINGAQKVTCRVAGIVPGTLGFHVGLKATATCAKGILVRIAATRSPQPSSAPAATTAPSASSSSTSAPPVASSPGTVVIATVNQGKVSVDGKGTLTAVGSGSVSFGSVVCSVRGGAPDYSAFKLGDSVSFHCEGPFGGDTTALLDGTKTGAFALTGISRL